MNFVTTLCDDDKDRHTDHDRDDDDNAEVWRAGVSPAAVPRRAAPRVPYRADLSCQKLIVYVGVRSVLTGINERFASHSPRGIVQ